MNRTTTTRARIPQIAHQMLDTVATILDALAPPRDDPRNPVRRRVARWACDSLALWHLCGKTCCRRARSCRGQPIECLSRRAPLLPPDVVADARAALARRRAGLPPLTSSSAPRCARWPASTTPAARG